MEQFIDETSVPLIESLQQLIEHLRQVFDSDMVNVDYVKAVLASYTSNPKDWSMYSNFDKDRWGFCRFAIFEFHFVRVNVCIEQLC